MIINSSICNTDSSDAPSNEREKKRKACEISLDILPSKLPPLAWTQAEDSLLREFYRTYTETAYFNPLQPGRVGQFASAAKVFKETSDKQKSEQSVQMESELIHPRTGKQIGSRWIEHLCPQNLGNIKKTETMKKILALYKRRGPQCSQISKEFCRENGGVYYHSHHSIRALLQRKAFKKLLSEEESLPPTQATPDLNTDSSFPFLDFESTDLNTKASEDSPIQTDIDMDILPFKSYPSNWTQAEDSLLREFYRTYRATAYLNPLHTGTYGQFTTASKVFKETSDKQKSEQSEQMESELILPRTGKQIRSRWIEHLCPQNLGNIQDTITVKKILVLYKRLGPQCAEISKEFCRENGGIYYHSHHSIRALLQNKAFKKLLKAEEKLPSEEIFDADWETPVLVSEIADLYDSFS